MKIITKQQQQLALIGATGLLLLLAPAWAADPAPQADRAAAASLRSILEHQQALARECAHLETIKWQQLGQVARFVRAHPQVHLPSALPVKLPAVCVFLFGGPAPARRPHEPARLDLVNWIYDADELAEPAEPAGRPDNITKRQAAANELSFAHEPTGALAHERHPLADYLLALDAPVSEADNELANDHQTHKFHQQVDQMLHDHRFRLAIGRSHDKLAAHLSPVILVPGLLGSRLQARVSKSHRVNIFCTKHSGWQDMWLSLRMFLPLAIDCWLDNVRMDFDPATGFTRPPAGVESRVPDFGSVESVRHLDLRSPKITKYFNALIERYQQIGYVPDTNLFAAPYDFRLAPQQLKDTYFEDLRRLVERARVTAKRKVTLVCHSMGCTHLLVFLRQQSAAWRQSRVRKLIALSSPWAGTVKALKALVVGDHLDLPLVSETKIRKLARTSPSIAYLLPQEQVFARPNDNQTQLGGPTLVETPNKSYKVGQIDELLTDLGLHTQLDWFKRTSVLIRPLEPLPDVHVDCIHSLNIPTPETLVFRNQSDFPDGEYELVNGEGDGTVNQKSLLVCADWAEKLPDKVKHKVIMNTNHLGVLSHPATLMHITDDVLMSDR